MRSLATKVAERNVQGAARLLLTDMHARSAKAPEANESILRGLIGHREEVITQYVLCLASDKDGEEQGTPTVHYAIGFLGRGARCPCLMGFVGWH